MGLYCCYCCNATVVCTPRCRRHNRGVSWEWWGLHFTGSLSIGFGGRHFTFVILVYTDGSTAAHVAGHLATNAACNMRCATCPLNSALTSSLHGTNLKAPPSAAAASNAARAVRTVSLVSGPGKSSASIHNRHAPTLLQVLALQHLYVCMASFDTPPHQRLLLHITCNPLQRPQIQLKAIWLTVRQRPIPSGKGTSRLDTELGEQDYATDLFQE